jgi:hypothetical protein
VLAAAERPPEELDGLADLVTVHFPWGSLLSGLPPPGMVVTTVRPAWLLEATRAAEPVSGR